MWNPINNTVQILIKGMFVAIKKKTATNSTHKPICHLIAISNPRNASKVMCRFVKVNTSIPFIAILHK